MDKPRVVISVETEQPTDSWSVGEAVLSLFDAQDRLRPEKLYQWEDEVADFTNIHDVEKFWSQKMQMSVAGSSDSVFAGLRWKRTRVLRYEAEIKHTTKNNRGAVIKGNFDLTAHLHNRIDWSRLFRDLVEAIGGSYGFVHLFDLKKIEAGEQPDRIMALSSGVSRSGKYPSLPLAFFAPKVHQGMFPEFDAKYLVEKTDHGVFYLPKMDWASVFSDDSVVDGLNKFNPEHLPAEFFEVRSEGQVD